MIRYEAATFAHPGASTPALRDVTLDVSEGELMLVAGPSGAGKSTLLRMANGLVPHASGGTFSGFVTAAGRDTRAFKPRDLADVCGFVPQDPDGSSVAASVEDEIVFVLENLGMPPSLMRKRVEETLDALGIAALRERRLDTLSGGERQRVAVAAVLVAAPSFLLLDEPTSQLDPQSAEEVLQTVLRLSHELGIGVMLAEHRLERVAAFADRMCVVSDGFVSVGDVRAQLARSPVAPPVVRLGLALGASDLPVSVREARSLVASLPVTPREPVAAAPGDVRVEVRGLRVALGGREVLHVPSFEVRAGETVAIVGRNGAGKSTLLRALAGLVRRMSGTVLLDRSATALVPQNASRILALPFAIDEVAQTLRLKKLSVSRAPEVLEEWGLSAFASRNPLDLSAGEATRLALAAACAASPGIVLLDEPTRGMDEPWKKWLAALLASWRAEGRAVVLVTHDVELVAEAATRVVLMSEGSIVLDGPVRSVLGESVMFSSQMNKVFGDRRIATVADAVAALAAGGAG